MRHMLAYGSMERIWVEVAQKKRAKSEQVAVYVPVVVSGETWNVAQVTRSANRSLRKHSTGYEYMLKGRIYCEHCGHRIGARTSHVNGKLYAYYRCNAYKLVLSEEYDHGSVQFSAQVVDPTVWRWHAAQLTDPKQLQRRLQEYQRLRSVGMGEMNLQKGDFEGVYNNDPMPLE